MEVILENRIRLISPPEFLKNSLMDLLRIANPQYLQAVSMGRSTFGIKKFIVNFYLKPNGDLIVPRGVLGWITDTCESSGIELTITNKRFASEYIVLESLIEYKPYQSDAVAKLISSGEEGLLVSPAGSGKTVMGLSLLPVLGQKTLWVTHTGVLSDQTKARAEYFLPNLGKIGMIGRGLWEIGEVLTIGMVQTLVRNPDKLSLMKDTFGMVIVDECHHTPSRTFTDVVSAFNSFYTYGLTATPYRGDGLENLMFQTIGPATSIVTMDKVSKHDSVVIPTVKYRSFESVVVQSNDIHKIIKNNIIYNKKRNELIVSDILNEAKNGHMCIVVSDRKVHCELLFEIIKARWEKTGIATGNNNKAHIREHVESLSKKDITVLVATTSLLGEGFDVPALDRAFICTPFRSQSKLEQLVGRLQRPSPGKSNAVVYDYVDENIGVLKNQFYRRFGECRCTVYNRLGVKVEK